MTKFNPENKTTLTFGEALGPAMDIMDEDDAVQYKRCYTSYIQSHLDTEPMDDGMTAEQIVNTNIGYYAGYYDNETRLRVEKLFLCVHPIFGSVKNQTYPY